MVSFVPSTLFIRPRLTLSQPLWSRCDPPHVMEENTEVRLVQRLYHEHQSESDVPLWQCVPLGICILQDTLVCFPCMQVHNVLSSGFGTSGPDAQWLSGVSPLSRKERSPWRWEMGWRVRGDRGHDISGWPADVCRAKRRSELTPIPFPCIPVRDIEIFETVKGKDSSWNFTKPWENIPSASPQSPLHLGSNSSIATYSFCEFG